MNDQIDSQIEHEPFISADKKIAEFTPIPLITGVILGIIFGASSLYLALKVGLTVSASIPVAVLSVTLFRSFSKIFKVRKTTILENNMVQTVGSAGESIAFGVAVTMPALLIMGYEMDLGKTMIVAVLGGLLGVLMMIPLRRALIVKEHGVLKYPEGTACAEVLIVGEKGGTSAITVFTGFFIGLFYKIMNVGLHLWKDTPEKVFSWFKGGQIAAEVSPELLGVGYIIGPRIASTMAAGGVLSSLVLIPAIKLFGDHLSEPLFPATVLISNMSIHDVWKNYVLYIGAGAVAAGGIISMVKSLPTIFHGAVAGISKIKGSGQAPVELKRTDRDLPMSFVGVGSLILIAAIWSVSSLHMNLMGSILIILFGFLFVTVSSRLTGEIGSSSNPISGMTVATLLLTCLIFLALGWVGPQYRVTALSVAAIVCIAASNGGTTSQDLKTGFLVGATPRLQQLGLLLGAFTSALVIGYTLQVLNKASTIYSQKNLPTNQINVAALTEQGGVEGPEGDKDKNQYHVLRISEFHTDGEFANMTPGKYLVGDDGLIKYIIDPGINGSLLTRDDGTKVTKYDAPKARLMSLIIDGILTQKLPWSLVLLGVFIAIVIEMCGIGSLAFAVGVYLPVSASVPIFAGGLVRWLSERKNKNLSSADSESSPGVLLSSGLIAGGAISGIALAVLSAKEGWLESIDLSRAMGSLANSDLFATLMFLGMGTILYWTGKKQSV